MSERRGSAPILEGETRPPAGDATARAAGGTAGGSAGGPAGGAAGRAAGEETGELSDQQIRPLSSGGNPSDPGELSCSFVGLGVANAREISEERRPLPILLICAAPSSLSPEKVPAAIT